MESHLKVENLGNEIKIYVSDKHTFGTDAFLLANFAAPKKNDICCDLGTGCGIIPLLWQASTAPLKSYAIDIQKEAIEQLNKTILDNNLKDKVVSLCLDIRTIFQTNIKNKYLELKKNTFDLITCNPPYKIINSGVLSRAESDKIARHETMCTMDDICQVSASLLQFGGRLCICQRPERLVDCICTMKKYSLEPKILRFVQDKQDKKPWLFLLESRKGGKPFLTVPKPFILKDDNGFTDEALTIYGRYKQYE